MVVSGGPITQESALIVANHISWMDIVVIRSLFPARFIAKEEIALWPVVGTSARKAGTFFIARRRLSSFRMTLEQVQKTLDNNGSVAVFPEGTTTCGDRILPFRSGLFEAAIRTGRPVLPIAIRYESPDHRSLSSISYTGGESFAKSFWRTLGEPRIIVRVHLLRSLDPAGCSRRELSGKAWTHLSSVLFPSS
ncbi:MAG: 1-acyl-sn-glycerol-3-phosphate acyltransferase [Nitrospirae bacterium]|nr:1-acyl-sn-glycerol-3-phosphate acyltransferase [Nitrospirota bacterium]